jgi:hypothetical protein
MFTQDTTKWLLHIALAFELIATCFVLDSTARFVFPSGFTSLQVRIVELSDPVLKKLQNLPFEFLLCHLFLLQRVVEDGTLTVIEQEVTATD